MDSAKENPRKGLMTKTWERCKSLGRNSKISSAQLGLTTKSKSCPRLMNVAPDHEEKHPRKRRVAPEGCFSVYVGPDKQRFVIKTEYANHPLFKILLEEAESEYGYDSRGPIALPCEVDIFCKVLIEMDNDEITHAPQGCGFPKGHGLYHLLSPLRLVA